MALGYVQKLFHSSKTEACRNVQHWLSKRTTKTYMYLHLISLTLGPHWEEGSKAAVWLPYSIPYHQGWVEHVTDNRHRTLERGTLKQHVQWHWFHRHKISSYNYPAFEVFVLGSLLIFTGLWHQYIKYVHQSESRYSHSYPHTPAIIEYKSTKFTCNKQ